MDDLQKERDFYKQCVSELGARLVKIQEDQNRVQQDARRSRTTAQLIREAYRLANADVSLEHLSHRFLQIILDHLNADRIIILDYYPDEGRFVGHHAMGFTPPSVVDFVPPEMPDGFGFRNGASAPDPVLDCLCRVAGVPFVLWAFRPQAKMALLLGNTLEDHLMHAPFEEGDREIIDGALGVYIDIVERKRIEAERVRLTQKAEAIGTLAGGIAHDFNNILQVILGYAQLAVEDVPKDRRSYRWLKEILIAGRRGADLVHQILTFSRQTEQERKPVRVQPIIKEALTLLRGSLPATIDICHHIDDNVGEVLADPTQIHQVVLNLCTNAYHAMRETGGALEVALDGVEVDPARNRELAELKRGSYACLTVRDTGHGMDKKTLERIFEPYFTTKQVGEGTGLGLATVQGIVQSQDGLIQVQSEPGNGSAFLIYLPLCSQDSAGTVEDAEDFAPVSGRERVLFVDDEEQIAQLGRLALEDLGFQVKARTSSIEAFEAFSSNPDLFDVVVTDQTMPNLTGMELARKILLIRPDMPIVICTGFSEVLNEDKAKSLGIREYIRKPIVKYDLARAIRRALMRENSRVEQQR